MRLVLCVTACAFAAVGRVWAQTPVVPETLTEADALTRQLVADPRMQAIRSGTGIVRAAQAERAYWPNPTVEVSRETAAMGSDLFVVGRQELPISGRLGRLKAAGRMAADAADAEAAYDVARLQADLRRSFARLLVAQQQEAVLRQAVGDLRTLIDVLRIREEAGEGSRYDRLRGERALVDLENDLASVALIRAEAQIDLAGSLGPNVNPQTLVAAGSLDETAPPAVEALINRALDARTDYRATEFAAARYDAERRAAAALRVPMPSVAYGLKRADTGAGVHNGYQLSLDVGLPLFNRGQSAVALATAEATRAGLERASLRLRIETEVRAAHVALTTELGRQRQYTAAVTDAAEPLSEIAWVAYDGGELGILELLDASRQLVDARLEVLNRAVATRLAGIELDRVTGVEVTP